MKRTEVRKKTNSKNENNNGDTFSCNPEKSGFVEGENSNFIKI